MSMPSLENNFIVDEPSWPSPSQRRQDGMAHARHGKIRISDDVEYNIGYDLGLRLNDSTPVAEKNKPQVFTCRSCGSTFPQIKLFKQHTCKAKKKKPKTILAANSEKCQFCSKPFVSKCNCAASIRWSQRKDKINVQAYAIYEHFSKIWGDVPKDQKHFLSNGRVCNPFINFAQFTFDNNAIKVKEFVKWLIAQKIPAHRWCKDSYYESYIKELLKKESPDSAVARSLKQIEKWTEVNSRPAVNYFKEASPIEFLFMLQAGRMSPWIIFVSETSDDLINRMTSEQQDILVKLMHPNIWTPLYNHRKQEVDELKADMKKAGF